MSPTWCWPCHRKAKDKSNVQDLELWPTFSTFVWTRFWPWYYLWSNTCSVCVSVRNRAHACKHKLLGLHYLFHPNPTFFCSFVLETVLEIPVLCFSPFWSSSFRLSLLFFFLFLPLQMSPAKIANDLHLLGRGRFSALSYDPLEAQSIHMGFHSCPHTTVSPATCLFPLCRPHFPSACFCDLYL